MTLKMKFIQDLQLDFFEKKYFSALDIDLFLCYTVNLVANYDVA